MTETATATATTIAVVAKSRTKARTCRHCPATIQLFQTLAGGWVPFVADPTVVKHTLDADGRVVVQLLAREKRVCGRRNRTEGGLF